MFIGNETCILSPAEICFKLCRYSQAFTNDVAIKNPKQITKTTQHQSTHSMNHKEDMHHLHRDFHEVYARKDL